MQAGEEDSGAFLKFSKTMTFSRKKYSQGGGERGAGPEHPRHGGIQRVKLKKFKCCNQMIFPIVSLLIHAEWI